MEGSSPLARGLRVLVLALLGLAGIIPARAGFTPPGRWTPGRMRDHPRSRGVYPLHPVGGGDPPGSSPLARGLPDIGVSINGWSGIIPARAGFTRHRGVDQRLVRDHPRSRGVYIGWGSDFASTMGSSPLARGLPPAAPRGGQRQRIIPARAGFTNRSTGAPITTRDHPRSRGVYSRMPPQWRRRSGSSPLARGLPSFTWDADGRPGIIPARAGFTNWIGEPRCVTWDHPRSRGVYRPWW